MLIILTGLRFNPLYHALFDFIQLWFIGPLVQTSPILVGFQKFGCRRESCDIFA